MSTKINEPLIKEVLLNAPIEKVWRAITDKDEMKKWYFELDEFKPEVGFKFQFTGGVEDRQYIHLCEITQVIKNKKITYSWKYEGFPGESYVTFELFEEDGKTRVKLTHTGVETFPQDNPDFNKNNFIEGCNYIIGAALKNYVEENN